MSNSQLNAQSVCQRSLLRVGVFHVATDWEDITNLKQLVISLLLVAT